MAALYDNSAKGSGAVGSATRSTASFAVGGSNRVLYAFVGSGSATTPAIPSTVKWNTSESLTQIGTTISFSGYRYTLWRLIAPTATTSTVDVTWGSSQDEQLVIAQSVKDCDQVTPNGTVAQAGPTASSAATVNAASNSGDLVLDGVFFGDDPGGAITMVASGSQTSRQEIEGAATTFEGLGSSTLTASGASTTMAWTLSAAPTGWAMYAFATNGSGINNALFYYKA